MLENGFLQRIVIKCFRKVRQGKKLTTFNALIIV